MHPNTHTYPHIPCTPVQTQGTPRLPHTHPDMHQRQVDTHRARDTLMSPTHTGHGDPQTPTHRDPDKYPTCVDRRQNERPYRLTDTSVEKHIHRDT